MSNPQKLDQLKKFQIKLRTSQPVISSSIPIGDDLITDNDIKLFFEINARCDNDPCNKKRESIIYGIVNDMIPNDWYIRQPYWILIRDEFNSIISRIFTQDYEHHRIEKVGGRKNHDFVLKYFNYGENTANIKLEFKYNCMTLTSYPEILSIYTNRLINRCDYADFFYDHYVERLAQLYGTEHPTKDMYMKTVFKSKTDVPFFKLLKTLENSHKKEKKRLVDSSIKEYLEMLISQSLIDIKQLNDKLTESQTDKIFVLFKNSHFYIEKIGFEQLTITRIEGIRNDNTIICKTCTDITLNFLLRWKNHAGILGPAWQIKVSRCK